MVWACDKAILNKISNSGYENERCREKRKKKTKNKWLYIIENDMSAVGV